MNTNTLSIAAAIVAVLLLNSQAKARRYHHPAAPQGQITQFCGDRYGACAEASATTAYASNEVRSHRRAGKVKRRYAAPPARADDRITRSTQTASYEDSAIVSHPAGCPRRAFCGCGVSVKVFGHPIRDLFLAANWRKFPPAHASAGMVAWRYGHVMYIMSANGDGTALVYDPNSGGHQTRIHTRDLAGYRIVDPNGNRVATLHNDRSYK